jgi:glycosyltransferase involved in cell wall biosynthesis
MQEVRILCMLDYGHNVNTGFCNQSKQIINSLKKNYLKINIIPHFDIIASNYAPDYDFKENKIIGEPFYKEDEYITVFSAVYFDGVKYAHLTLNQRGLFGHHIFCEMLEDEPYSYDYIFILNDIPVILPMIDELKRIKSELKKQNKKQFKSVFYFPIDGNLDKSVDYSPLLFFNKLITCTNYGKNKLIKLNNKLNNKISVISHSINTNSFYPIHNKEQINLFKSNYFGELNNNKLIIGIINRNQHRKDIPTALFAFIEAWKLCNKNIFLYLHFQNDDPMGWNIRKILSQTELVEGVDYSFPNMHIREISDVTLNFIYNSIDLYLSTTLGEGFGLTAIEAMATKTLCLIPKNTSYIELGKGRTLQYDMTHDVCFREDNTIREQGDYYEIADIIHNYYKNGKIYYNDLVEKSYNFVKTISTDAISTVWVDLFNKL